jgi:hypothetical protein
MHDNSADEDDGRRTDPQDSAKSVAAGGLSATDYCRLAEECMALAVFANDAEKAAEFVKTGDDYLRRAAQLIADRLKND